VGDQQLAETIEVRVPDETLETPLLAPELALGFALPQLCMLPPVDYVAASVPPRDCRDRTSPDRV